MTHDFYILRHLLPTCQFLESEVHVLHTILYIVGTQYKMNEWTNQSMSRHSMQNKLIDASYKEDVFNLLCEKTIQNSSYPTMG